LRERDSGSTRSIQRHKPSTRSIQVRIIQTSDDLRCRTSLFVRTQIATADSASLSSSHPAKYAVHVVFGREPEREFKALFSDWAWRAFVVAVAESEGFVVRTFRTFYGSVVVEDVDVLASAGCLFVPCSHRRARHTDGEWFASTAFRVARSW